MWGRGIGFRSPWEETGNEPSGKAAFIAHENLGATAKYTVLYSVAFRV